MPDRRHRYQRIRTAKIRSHTRIGWTTARLPKLSATTCRANPTRFAPRAVTHNGCRTRSSRIRGDSARRLSTRFVVRWSATEDIPSISADATAATTAISGDKLSAFLLADRTRMIMLVTGFPAVAGTLGLDRRRTDAPAPRDR